MDVTSEHPSFDDLLANLRQQDNEAAREVFQRFRQRLIGLARQKLEGRLRAKLDPEDVVQSVFHTVFRRLAQGEFDLGDWDSLWGLLTCITVRKCGKWREYFYTQGRDVTSEVPAPSGSSSAWQCIDREPTSEEVAMLTETVQTVLKGLDEREQQVVTLSLQGYTVTEVSGTVGCTESKVYRVLRHVRARLERMRATDD